MRNLRRIITHLSPISLSTNTTSSRLLNEKAIPVFRNGAVTPLTSGIRAHQFVGLRAFSAKSGGDGENDGKDERFQPPKGSESDNLGWDSMVSPWSTGRTNEYFDGEVAGRRAQVAGRRASDGGESGDKDQSAFISSLDEIEEHLKAYEAANRKSKSFVDGWGERMREMSALLKQVREPGIRGSYLKDSEKAEMYKLHKENPEVYTVEKLAKDYRIMRQRVHAILWLKEIEEEEEKKRGPLDDSVEVLLDSFPEFFKSHDREFHVASLPYKPDFKVMPEDWDGTARDRDEVHYEISKKEDEILYKEFVQRLEFNKMRVAGKVFKHQSSRRRSSDGWKITVEKLGPRGKRGGGGGWKFVSKPDGSSRPLNEMEKMFLKRETPRRRRKILP